MKRRRGPGETNHSVAHAARLLRTTSAKGRTLIAEGKLEWTQERDGGPIKVNARSLANFMGFAARPGKRQAAQARHETDTPRLPELAEYSLEQSGDVFLDIPVMDHWVIASMANAVARRLIDGERRSERRESLLQILWSLQRLPRVPRETSWTVSAGEGEDSLMLRLSPDGLHFARCDEGATIVALDYTAGGHRLATMHEEPAGSQREAVLRFQMRSFSEYMEDPSQTVHLEYYGPSPESDAVPLHVNGSEQGRSPR